MPDRSLPRQSTSVPASVADAHPIVQKAYVATGVNQASILHREAVEKAVSSALHDVVIHLRFTDWQEDTAAEAVLALWEAVEKARFR